MRIEATAVLVSCILMISTGSFNHTSKPSHTETSIAVGGNHCELKLKEINTIKNKNIIPKISIELENQIEKSLKIIDRNAENQKQIQYDKDLYLLAQVIYAEAGSDWISDNVQLMVGNVVMNRVMSDKFPDTIYDVVHAPNQYQFIKHGITVKPSKRALDNARKILNGVKVMPKNVYYQSEYKNLGDGIYKKVKTKYSTMYFSYSK